jgi:hypothetical protein
MDNQYDNVTRYISLADIIDGTKPLDSSMTVLYKECPRRFFYRYVLGRDVKDEPIYFRFGGAYHKFREQFELILQENGGQLTPEAATKAISVAVKQFLDGGGNPPIGSWYEYMTDARLQMSCIEAIKKIRNERITRTFTVLSVEMPFSVQMPDGFYTAGRIDQVILHEGEVGLRDFKTASRFGDSYERKLNPNDQFSRYMYALTLLRGTSEHIPDEPIRKLYVEVMHNTKTVGPKLHTLLASRSNEQLSNWLKDATTWNHKIKKSFEDDNWPMNEAQCDRCPFHKVCSSPTTRMQINRLENDYEIRVWNPLEHEGGSDD